MTSTLDILASFPSPSRGVWELGPIPLRAYAFFIIVGIIVAIYWGERRWIARGGEPGIILDIAVWAVPFGLIGGRLYHVATDWTTYFGDGGHPIDALKIWEGGLGIWGAVLLGGVGAWIGCRIRGIPLAALGDAVAPPILLAQAIGRLGNYFNQELYGRETDLPWGLTIYERINSNGAVDALNGVSTGVDEKVVHPTFLYELLWNLAIVGLLVFVDRRFKIGHGRLFALYVAGYCAGRFWVELLRDDYATHIGGIRINSFTSAIVFVGAVAYFVFAKKGREAPEELLAKNGPATESKPAVETNDAAAADDAVESESEAKTETPDKVELAKTEPAETEAEKAEPKKAEPAEPDKTEPAEPENTEPPAAPSITSQFGAVVRAAGRAVGVGTATSADESKKDESKEIEPTKDDEPKAEAAPAKADEPAEKVGLAKKAEQSDKPDETGDADKAPAAAEPTENTAPESVSDERAESASSGDTDTDQNDADTATVNAEAAEKAIQRRGRRLRALWQRGGQ